MAKDYCPFLKDTNKVFGPSYICGKTEREIMTGETILRDYCSAGERYYTQCPHFKPEPSAGCFLTSACVEAMGLPDDCPELTALRAFRDEWLTNQPGGEAQIAEYYRIAPAIVEGIKARGDARDVFQKIYDEMIIPCLQLIQENRFQAARELYGEKTKALQSAYCV